MNTYYNQNKLQQLSEEKSKIKATTTSQYSVTPSQKLATDVAPTLLKPEHTAYGLKDYFPDFGNKKTKNLEKEINYLQSELNKSCKQIKYLESELNKSSKQNHDYKKNVETSNKTINELTNKLKKMEIVTSQLEEYKTKCNELTSQVVDYENTKIELENLAILTEKYEKMCNELIEELADSEKTIIELENYKSSCIDLTNKLADIKTTKMNLQMEMENLSKNFEVLAEFLEVTRLSSQEIESNINQL